MSQSDEEMRTYSNNSDIDMIYISDEDMVDDNDDVMHNNLVPYVDNMITYEPDNETYHHIFDYMLNNENLELWQLFDFLLETILLCNSYSSVFT